MQPFSIVIIINNLSISILEELYLKKYELFNFYKIYTISYDNSIFILQIAIQLSQALFSS